MPTSYFLLFLEVVATLHPVVVPLRCGIQFREHDFQRLVRARMEAINFHDGESYADAFVRSGHLSVDYLCSRSSDDALRARARECYRGQDLKDITAATFQSALGAIGAAAASMLRALLFGPFSLTCMQVTI